MNFMKKILTTKEGNEDLQRTASLRNQRPAPPPPPTQHATENQSATCPTNISLRNRIQNSKSVRRPSEYELKRKSMTIAEGGVDGETHDSVLDLNVMHLNRLFVDIETQNTQLLDAYGHHGPSRFDQAGLKSAAELEQKIYRLLPLFLKTFSAASVEPQLFEKFCDLASFTQIISKLMVSEIRKRASNKTTEEASQAIVDFLQLSSSGLSPSNVTSPTSPSPSQPPPPSSSSSSSSLLLSNANPLLQQLQASQDNRGWVLLSTLNLLACNGSKTLVPIMASSSLPSTLVKCLYLFFDLPEVNESSNESDSNKEPDADRPRFGITSSVSVSKLSMEMLHTEQDRRLLLQRVFTQLLVKLCAHPTSLYELTRKDDLALLFTAITGWCPQRSNLIWRQTAADVMLAITKAGCADLTYLHEKQCVIVCLENLSKMLELGQAQLDEICDLCCTLINFFVELVASIGCVSASSVEEETLYKQMVGVLLEDFQNAHGYSFLQECILRLETATPSLRWPLHRLISLLTQLSKCGTSEIKCRPLSVNQLFIMDGFTMPKSNAKGSIKNLKAFNILLNLWSKSHTAELQELLLAGLNSIYKFDKANYFVLDSQNALCQFAEQLCRKPIAVQERFFAILEYIIFELRYVPCKELISVGNNLKSNYSMDCDLLYLRSLSSIIKFNAVFRDVYREVGLFDIICNLFLNESEAFARIAVIYGKGPQDDELMQRQQEHLQLIELCVEIVQHTLTGPNASNCSLFIKMNALPMIYSYFIQKHSGISKQIRMSSVAVLHQLILNGCDESHLAIPLALLQATFGPEVDKSWSGVNKIVRKRAEKENVEDHQMKERLRVELCEQVQTYDLEHRIKLRLSTLKLLMNLLKESHRCRAVFRKAGGFQCLMNVLICMKEYFCQSTSNDRPDLQIKLKNRCKLLHRICAVIMLAMRFEPANAKFFANEIGSFGLASAMQQLGCFTSKCKLEDDSEELDLKRPDKNVIIVTRTPQPTVIDQFQKEFDYILNSNVILLSSNDSFSCEKGVCLVMKLLIEMATDQLEKNRTIRFEYSDRAIETNVNEIVETQSESKDEKLIVSTIDANSNVDSCVIVHPNVIITIFRLLPSIGSPVLKQLLLNKLIGQFLQRQRNQQALCEAGLISELLSNRLKNALLYERHSLHSHFRTLFVQLARQQIHCHQLRTFIRLARPPDCSLCHSNSDNGGDFFKQMQRKTGSIYLPTNAIKTLISIVVEEERQNRALNVHHLFKAQPPFIEFDMSQEGFSCIFLPSIAPVSLNAGSGGGNFLNQNLITNAILSSNELTQQQNQINGGIGVGERPFPPQGGLTYMSWVCVDKLPPPGMKSMPNKIATLDDPANVRLLSVVRIQKSGTQFACLQIQLSAIDRSLLICTQEQPIFGGGPLERSNQLDSDCFLRVSSRHIQLQTGRWHHIGVVLSKALLKNSTATVYVDGKQITSQRLNYPANVVGSSGGLASSTGIGGSSGGSGNGSSSGNTMHVNAYIGTPPQLRKQCTLRWKQGPCILIEEPLPAAMIACLYSLGPNYVGSMQGFSNSINTLASVASPIPFSNKPTVHNQLSHTISLPNTSGVLSSAQLTSGSGNLVHLQILAQHQLSEDKVMFGLNARAHTMMTLAKLRRVYSRFDCKQLAKLLSLSIHENATPIAVLHNSAGHLNGPARSLGGILVGYVGCRLFHPRPASRTLTELGGCAVLLGAIASSQTEEQLRESIRMLVSVLRCSRGELQLEMQRLNGYQMLAVLLRKRRSLLSQHSFHLIAELACEYLTVDQPNVKQAKRIMNLRAFKELLVDQLELWWLDDCLLKPLLGLYTDLLNGLPEYHQENIRVLRNLGLSSRLLYSLRMHPMCDAQMLAQLKSLLFQLLQHTPQQCDLLYFGQFLASMLPINTQNELSKVEHIQLRNYLLKLMLQLLTGTGSQTPLQAAVQEELVRILGFDWFCLFFSGPHLHPQTVQLGLLNVFVLLSNPSLYIKFREGTSNGGWLKSIPCLMNSGNNPSSANSALGNAMGDDSTTSDMKLLGFNMSSLGGNLTTAIETNLNSLNNLTIENINESINSSLLERSDSIGGSTGASGLNFETSEQFNLCGQKIEPLLFTIPGFQLLSWYLQDHLDQPPVYLLLFQCLLGELQTPPPDLLQTLDQFSQLDTSQMELLLNVNRPCSQSKNANSPQHQTTAQLVAPDLTLAFLSMIHRLVWNRSDSPTVKMNQTRSSEDDKPDAALKLMRFFAHLYECRRDLQLYCENNADFLVHLGRLLIHEQPPQSGRYELTSHPIEPVVLTLLQRILIDGILCTNRPLAKHQVQMIRQSLQCFQRCPSAQTRLLGALLHRLHLLMDRLASQQHFVAVPPQKPQQLPLLTNVISFLGLLTDQLWAETLQTHDARELLQFLLNVMNKLSLEEFLANSSTHKLNFSNDLPALHRCSNRTLLYLLSRPLDSIADRMALLEVLQTVISNRKRLLSPLNQDSQFFACLTYCLLQFIDQERVRLTPVRTKSHSTWHVINTNLNSLNHSNSSQSVTSGYSPSPPPPNTLSSPARPPSADLFQANPGSADSSRCGSPATAGQCSNNVGGMSDQPDEGALLVSSSARKIWEEIFMNKRTQIEEAIRVNLSLTSPSFGFISTGQELNKLRDQLLEPTQKAWINYLEGELQLRNAARRCRSAGPSVNNTGSGFGNNSGGSSGDTSGFALNNIANVSERLTQINRLSKVMGSGAGLMSKLVINTVSSTMKKDAFRMSGSGNVASSVDFSIGGQTFASGNRSTTSIPVWTLFNRPEFGRLTQAHLSLLVETMQLSWRTKWQRDLHVLKYVLHDWQQLEYELLQRPRAIFGFECSGGTGLDGRLDKWQLDLTEGPNRMRKKLMRNELFYVHYPYRPEMDCPKNLRLLKCKQPISWDSLELHKRQQLSRSDGQSMDDGDEDSLLIEAEMLAPSLPNLIGSDQSTSRHQPQQQPLIDSKIKTEKLSVLGNEPSIDVTEAVLNIGGGSCSAQLEQLECQSVLRLLEEGEKITAVFKCARVLGLDTMEGLLLFGKEHFYLLDGFTILKNGELRDIDSLPASQSDPVVPSSGITAFSSTSSGGGGGGGCNTSFSSASAAATTGQTSSSNSTSISSSTKQSSAKQSCMKFAYDEIREVHKRRYLLQPIALELFCLDGRNALLVFTRTQRNKLYARFLTVAVNMNDNVAESLSGQRRNVSVESGSNILTSLIAEPSVTQRWVRGEISNFQYLMHLNTLAGRSYNDLMQYPIFPWILCDYDSQQLDLRDPRVYRDLSKPMGAQSEHRLQQFIRRYREFDCIQDSPPYHYGTFYSSAMIVASYLVRMEPFTQHFLRLQGGHFDLADRMFHSIRDAWLSASCHNMADVKELIPEFFYLPEFLLNSNRFDFGVKQSGIRLDHIQLPAWAKGDPKEFIRLHRAALESDYVSAHLHEWIDLIFGYKQQGQPAVEAVNVFHHLFYEGNVDIYTIEDPLRKNAIIGFINNFGQIPKQLFKRPHPVKKVFTGFSGAMTGQSSVTNQNTGNVFFGPAMQWPSNQPSNAATGVILANSSPPAASSQLNTPPISSIPLSPLLTSVLGSASGGSGSGSGSGPPTSAVLPNSSTDRLIVYNPHNLVQTSHVIKELRGCVGQIVQQEKTLLAVEQNKVLIPPQFNKYVAWGFADQSIRVGNYESDRALAVYECDLLPSNGEILCCSVASSRLMITGGANSLVSVWRLKQKLSRLELLQHLFGHRDAITCLSSSAVYGLLVSGSRDRTCIVWDLNRLTFVRQLSFIGESALAVLDAGLCRTSSAQSSQDNLNRSFDRSLDETKDADISGENWPQCNRHPAPISAICINELSGDIVTCCGSLVFLWTINGELLACADLQNCKRNVEPTNSPSPAKTGSLQILCACFSLYNEWELCNVIALGCSDGAVRLFSVQFEQLDKPVNSSSDSVIKTEESISISETGKKKNQDQETTTQTTEPEQIVLESVAPVSVPVPSTSNERWIRRLVLQAELRPNFKDICAVSAVSISKDCRIMYVGDVRGRVFSFIVNLN